MIINHHSIQQGLAWWAPNGLAAIPMRLNSQSAAFKNGSVLLLRSAPRMANYLHELTRFSGNKFDDKVDSTTQALAWLGIRMTTLRIRQF